MGPQTTPPSVQPGQPLHPPIGHASVATANNGAVTRRKPSRPTTRKRVTSGISLAWKVTIPVLVVASLTMIAIGTATRNEAREALLLEFDDYGVSVVKTLATPSMASWSSTDQTVVATAQRVVELADEYRDYLELRHGITVEPPDLEALRKGKLSPEFEGQQARAIAEYRSRQEQSRGRLSALLAHGDAATDNGGPKNAHRDSAASGELHKARRGSNIVDAFIRDEETRLYVVRASTESLPFISGGPLRDYLDGSTGVQIGDGKIGDIAVRAFSHPIDDPDQPGRYRAYAFLRSSPIVGYLEPLRLRTRNLGVLFVLAAGLVTYLVTRLAVAPLKTLAHDAEIIAAGDLHHRTEVHTDDEIGMLARTLDNMVRRIDYTMSGHDAQVSTDLHRKMLAEAIPYLSRHDVEVVHLPARGIGGAGYDFLDLPEKRVGLVVTEASNQGVPAATNVIMAEALLRAEGAKCNDPATILAHANEGVHRGIHSDASVAAVVATIAPKERKIVIAGAGGLPFWIYRAASNTIERRETSPVPLGHQPGPAGAPTDATVQLECGDRLILANRLTDHIVNEKGAQLGLDQWERFLEQSEAFGPQFFVEELRQRLSAYRGKARLRNEVVVMFLHAH